mmetsp:Transcript_55587/g.169052  ORF Transcript_55587/g.169052 Transcript_55587/m.169052 type:complete len:224 (+) Transcript_55587:99-770(+)
MVRRPPKIVKHLQAAPFAAHGVAHNAVGYAPWRSSKPGEAERRPNKLGTTHPHTPLPLTTKARGIGGQHPLPKYLQHHDLCSVGHWAHSGTTTVQFHFGAPCARSAAAPCGPQPLPTSWQHHTFFASGQLFCQPVAQFHPFARGGGVGRMGNCKGGTGCTLGVHRAKGSAWLEQARLKCKQHQRRFSTGQRISLAAVSDSQSHRGRDGAAASLDGWGWDGPGG